MANKKRKIEGLKHATFLKDRPTFSLFNKKRSKHLGFAKGAQFEDKVVRYLKSYLGDNIRSGIWIKYEDDNGEGWAEIDLMILPIKMGDPILVVECKYTTTRRAYQQLSTLYKPLVQYFYPDTEVKMLQIAKNLSLGNKDKLFRDISEVIADKKEWEYATLIWRFK
jgi:hypothetical protein